MPNQIGSPYTYQVGQQEPALPETYPRIRGASLGVADTMTQGRTNFLGAEQARGRQTAQIMQANAAMLKAQSDKEDEQFKRDMSVYGSLVKAKAYGAAKNWFKDHIIPNSDEIFSKVNVNRIDDDFLTQTEKIWSINNIKGKNINKKEMADEFMALAAEYSKGDEVNIEKRAAEMMRKDNVPKSNTGDVDIDYGTLDDERAYYNKALNEADARKILQETGGDKEKARELAKQRGYNF